MQTLSTWFWFDGTAEQAATFYADVFGGEVMTASFTSSDTTSMR